MTAQYRFTLSAPARRLHSDAPALVGKGWLKGIELGFTVTQTTGVFVLRMSPTLKGARWDVDEQGTVELRSTSKSTVGGVWKYGSEEWSVEASIKSVEPFEDEESQTPSDWKYMILNFLQK